MHALRAAHAFDGTRFLPGGATVFLDGDRIVGVESGRVDVPDRVEVTEYAGTVLPGLIDCHTHLVADATPGGLERAGAMPDEPIDRVITDSLRAHVVAGVTTVRDLGDRDYRTLAFRERPGLPRVVASGPPLTTPGGHCQLPRRSGGPAPPPLFAELMARLGVTSFDAFYASRTAAFSRLRAGYPLPGRGWCWPRSVTSSEPARRCRPRTVSGM